MQRNAILTIISTAILAVPFVVFAQAPRTFSNLVDIIIGVFNNAVVPLIFALAFIAFVWGVFQYMFFPGDEKKLEQGRSMIIYGLIGLFVMFSVWGLVSIVQNTLF